MHDADRKIVTTDTRRDAGLGERIRSRSSSTPGSQQNGFVFGTNAAGVQRRAGPRSGQRLGELGRQLGGENQRDGWRLVGRVPHSAADAALRSRAADVGRQLLPEHPAPPGARLLGAARPHLRPRPAVVGGRAARAQPADTAQFQGAALRRELGQPEFLAGDRHGSTAISASTPSASRQACSWTPLQHDFAQSVDTQINLTRFNLPGSVRSLENSGLFAIGKGQELDLFFNRSIGLDDNGALVAIKGGGRLSGKTEAQHRRTQQTDDVAPQPRTTSVARQPRAAEPVGTRDVRRCTATGTLSRSNAAEPDVRADALRSRQLLQGVGLRTPKHRVHWPRLRHHADSEWDDGHHRLIRRGDRRGLQPRRSGFRKQGRLPAFLVRFEETLRQERAVVGFPRAPAACDVRYNYLDGGLQNAELHVDNHWDTGGNFSRRTQRLVGRAA